MKFHVRLPVFNLQGGMRGILVYARVHEPPDGHATVHLFREDGKYIPTVMALPIVQAASQNGPFVNLMEVTERAPLGLIDPNGKPLA